MTKPATIDEYIASFPKEIQKLLELFKATITQAAPGADGIISYGIPAFRLGKMLVWFAAHTNHIGFYPRGSAIEAFKHELSDYTKAPKVPFSFRLTGRCRWS